MSAFVRIMAGSRHFVTISVVILIGVILVLTPTKVGVFSALRSQIATERYQFENDRHLHVTESHPVDVHQSAGWRW